MRRIRGWGREKVWRDSENSKEVYLVFVAVDICCAKEYPAKELLPQRVGLGFDAATCQDPPPVRHHPNFVVQLNRIVIQDYQIAHVMPYKKALILLNKFRSKSGSLGPAERENRQ